MSRNGNGEIPPDQISDALLRKIERREEAKRRARRRLREVLQDWSPADEGAHEKRLRAFQEARDLDVLDENIAFFLISVEAERISGDRTWEIWVEEGYKEKQDALREEYGLSEKEYFAKTERPEEFVELDERFDTISDTQMLQTLREYGEFGMADLYEHDREEYNSRRESGRSELFPDKKEIEKMMDEPPDEEV